MFIADKKDKTEEIIDVNTDWSIDLSNDSRIDELSSNKLEFEYAHLRREYEKHLKTHLNHAKKINQYKDEPLSDTLKRIATYKDGTGFDKEENQKTFKAVAEAYNLENKNDVKKKIREIATNLLKYSVFKFEYSLKSEHSEKIPDYASTDVIYNTINKNKVMTSLLYHDRLAVAKEKDENVKADDLFEKHELKNLNYKPTLKKTQSHFSRAALRRKADTRFLAKFDQSINNLDRDEIQEKWYEASSKALSPAVRLRDFKNNSDKKEAMTYTLVIDIDAHEGNSPDRKKRIVSRQKAINTLKKVIIIFGDKPTLVEKSTKNGGFHVYFCMNKPVYYSDIKLFEKAFNVTTDPVSESKIETRSENMKFRLPLAYDYEYIIFHNFEKFIAGESDLIMMYSPSMLATEKLLLNSINRKCYNVSKILRNSIEYFREIYDSSEKVKSYHEKHKKYIEERLDLLALGQLAQNTAQFKNGKTLNLNSLDIDLTVYSSYQDLKKEVLSKIDEICQIQLEKLHTRLENLKKRPADYRGEVSFDENGNANFKESDFADMPLLTRKPKKDKADEIIKHGLNTSNRTGSVYKIEKYDSLNDILTDTFIKENTIYSGQRHEAMIRIAAYFTFLNNVKNTKLTKYDYRQAIIQCNYDSKDIQKWLMKNTFNKNCDNLFENIEKNFDIEKIKTFDEYLLHNHNSRKYNENDIDESEKSLKHISNRNLLRKADKDKLKALTYYLADKEKIRRSDEYRKAVKTYYILFLEIYGKFKYENLYDKMINKNLPMRLKQRKLIQENVAFGIKFTDSISETYKTSKTYERMKNILFTMNYSFNQKKTDTNVTGWLYDLGHLDHSRQFSIPDYTGTDNKQQNIQESIHLAYAIVTRKYDSIKKKIEIPAYKKHIQETLCLKNTNDKKILHKDLTEVMIIARERVSLIEYEKSKEILNIPEVYRAFTHDIEDQLAKKSDTTLKYFLSKLTTRFDYGEEHFKRDEKIKIAHRFSIKRDEELEELNNRYGDNWFTKTNVESYKLYQSMTVNNTEKNLPEITNNLTQNDMIEKYGMKQITTVLSLLNMKELLPFLHDLNTRVHIAIRKKVHRSGIENTVTYYNKYGRYEYIPFLNNMNTKISNEISKYDAIKSDKSKPKYHSFIFMSNQKFTNTCLKTPNAAYAADCLRSHNLSFHSISNEILVTVLAVRGRKEKNNENTRKYKHYVSEKEIENSVFKDVKVKINLSDLGVIELSLNKLQDIIQTKYISLLIIGIGRFSPAYRPYLDAFREKIPL